jgi:hypothetical protein
MSTYADAIHPASQAATGFHPFSRFREFLHAARPMARSEADEDVRTMPRSRHDALIYAARTALGGTVEW